MSVQNLPVVQSLEIQAAINFQALCENPYSGRGIVLGISDLGHPTMIYWIGGRSENSQNRVLTHENGKVFTEAADPAKVKDPSLIIYNAMLEGNDRPFYTFIVSNGHQTDTIRDRMLHRSLNLFDAMIEWKYEPDKPNFTPRISAVIEMYPDGTDMFSISSLRKSPCSDKCDSFLYKVNPTYGIGYCLTTYSGDGDPLPSYRGEPYLVPLSGSSGAIADAYWSALDEDTRVALVVKTIDSRTYKSSVKIINRFKKVT